MLNRNDIPFIVRENEGEQIALQHLRGVAHNAEVVDVTQAGALLYPTLGAHQHILKPLGRRLIDRRVYPMDNRIADFAVLEAVDWNADFLHQLRL